MKFGIVTAMALAVLALVTGGCGEAKKDAAIKIGISIPGADHGWTGGAVFWAEQAKKKIEGENKDVKVIISTARDAAEQVDRVENLLMQGIQALVILPHEPGPLTRVCEEVKAKGVYLVVVDRGLEKPIEDLTIAGDNPGFGRAGAEALAKALGGKGNIVMMEGIPCVVNSDRVNAFREVMKNYPGIKILDSQAANWDTEKGLKLMENFLQKYPAIDGVWTGDDDVLLGALKAYEESKRKDIRCFVGGAGAKTVVKMIIDGNPLVPFDVTYPPKMVEVAAGYALAGARKAPLTTEKKVVIPAEIINRDNAAKFYYPDSVF